jgi:GAF domain
MTSARQSSAPMSESEQLRAELSAAMAGAGSPLAAADRLCQACVTFLGVDGASISLMHDGTTRGTFGSSGELSRRLDELQFTFGEGPCLDAVRDGTPVLVPDLDDPTEQRWPSFRGACVESGINAVFSLPVTVASDCVGALDLFKRQNGTLSDKALNGGLVAAELGSLPLLELMTADVDWDSASQGAEGWEQLASLERIEVYQATGMIIGALDVGPTEALLRLRGYAFGHDMTASEVAWAIVERRLSLDSGDWLRDPGDTTGTTDIGHDQ